MASDVLSTIYTDTVSQILSLPWIITMKEVFSGLAASSLNEQISILDNMETHCNHFYAIGKAYNNMIYLLRFINHNFCKMNIQNLKSVLQNNLEKLTKTNNV